MVVYFLYAEFSKAQRFAGRCFVEDETSISPDLGLDSAENSFTNMLILSARIGKSEGMKPLAAFLGDLGHTRWLQGLSGR